MVIASQPVHRTLRLFGERETFPTVASVAEALHHFADSIGERRRLLPLLTKTARQGAQVLIDLRWLSYLLHGRHSTARTASH